MLITTSSSMSVKPLRWVVVKMRCMMESPCGGEQAQPVRVME
jgi:hypothetical protein